MRSVASSLSSSKAMFPLTKRVGQPAETRHQRSFYQTFCHPTAQIWTRLTAKYMRNAAAGLASSWRQGTEAVVDRCVASFQAKHHRGRSWWVVQMFLCVNLCERRKNAAEKWQQIIKMHHITAAEYSLPIWQLVPGFATGK